TIDTFISSRPSPGKRRLQSGGAPFRNQLVVLNLILAALAFLSLGILLWQFVVAVRFPLHQRIADPAYAPPVTLLKPLKGVDAETWHCPESWSNQDYAGPVQILFGVASADDPVCEMAGRSIAARPE